MRTALSIAGSDSVGGAGIQADIKAMTAVGVHAATVVTAVTAQNTCAVRGILPIPAEMIGMQLEAVLDDCEVRAAKTGMLYNAETVATVAEVLADRGVPLTADPVMVATVGDRLADTTLLQALKDRLLPVCDLVTPNLREAELLSGIRIENRDDAVFACEIIGKGGTSVLLKGGHMDTAVVTDYLYLSSEITEIRNPRLERAGHGSGCTLSAYITAYRAKGEDLMNSVLKARTLMQESIAAQYRIGRGEPVIGPCTGCTGDDIRYAVLKAVDDAAEALVGTVPPGYVSEAGINLAYALPNASGPGEVAAVDKRISLHDGKVVRNGQAKFGVAGRLSYALLEVMRTDPGKRSIVSLRDTGSLADIVEEIGFDAVSVDEGGGSLSERVRRALGGRPVPEAIVLGDEGIVLIVGRDPADILSKMGCIF